MRKLTFPLIIIILLSAIVHAEETGGCVKESALYLLFITILVLIGIIIYLIFRLKSKGEPAITKTKPTVKRKLKKPRIPTENVDNIKID